MGILILIVPDNQLRLRQEKTYNLRSAGRGERFAVSPLVFPYAPCVLPLKGNKVLVRQFIGIIASFTPIAAVAAPPVPDVRDGAAAVVWSNAYQSAGEDWINDIVALRDGEFLAIGFLNRVDGETASDWRALASRFAAGGSIRWTKEYGAGGAIDAFWAVREGADGALIFGGLTTRIGPGGINAYVAVTAGDGETAKENGYGTSGYDRITGLAPAADGYIGAGHAEGLDGRDTLLIGLDANGVEIWRRVFAEKGSNGALYIEPAGDGNFIVAGGTSPEGMADILVVKVDSGGKEIWRRTIGASATDDINHGLAVLRDGRIALAGYTNSWGAGEHDLLLALLDANGETLSIETIGGAGDEHARSLKEDRDGRLWIVGHTASAGGDQEGIVARADRNGRFEDGILLLGGAGEDVVSALHPLGADDILIGGYGGEAASDAYVARLSDIKLRAHPAFKVRRVKGP